LNIFIIEIIDQSSNGMGVLKKSIHLKLLDGRRGEKKEPFLKIPTAFGDKNGKLKACRL
jgi:hypothetical protein